MAREWHVWDDWAAGGFFAGGSFRGGKRFNSLNMQRYENGSIGPRPGWRLLTNTNDGYAYAPASATGTTATSVAAADRTRLQAGVLWTPEVWGDSTIAADYGTFVLVGMASGEGRRMVPRPDGTLHIYTSSARSFQIASFPPPGSWFSTGYGYGVNFFGQRQLVPGAESHFGLNTYTLATDTLGALTPVTSTYRPRLRVMYRNRAYGWYPMNEIGAEGDYTVHISGTANFTDFSDTTNGAGQFTVLPNAKVVGLWALGSGLLIFSNPGVPYAEDSEDGTGFWHILTGPTPASGTLTPLDFDAGPLIYTKSVQFQDRVMFPVEGNGWMVHDGARLDKNVLSELKPGRGVTPAFGWKNAVRTYTEHALILPFEVTETDPTAENQTGGDRIGEFWSHGHGAFEFVNDAWTEALYLHGQGDIGAGYGRFMGDKLFVAHLDSSDGGTNYHTTIYVRDVTLNRPAVSTSGDTYNPWSSATETAPTQAGGATGAPECLLETAEFQVPENRYAEAQTVIIDYDYWNSSLFDSDCGFEVDVIVRGADGDKFVVPGTSARVTPPATSLTVTPKRARVTLNLPSFATGATFQVRVRDITGVAIHSIALGYDTVNNFR